MNPNLLTAIVLDSRHSLLWQFKCAACSSRHVLPGLNLPEPGWLQGGSRQRRGMAWQLGSMYLLTRGTLGSDFAAFTLACFDSLHTPNIVRSLFLTL